MKKIIVAGAGHGGIVAAYHLAKDGFDVTIYEQGEKGKLGHEQSDFIQPDGFEKSGIPIPEEYYVKRTPITFCVLGTDIKPLVQENKPETFDVEIDRNALYSHLLELAEEAGVKIVYGCRIESPLMLGSRIIGIRTSCGDFYADLVIDACGVDSVLRSALPPSFHIQQQAEKFDVLKVYRAYFDKNKDVSDCDYRFKVSLLPGEFCGITWVFTCEDSVDILIGSLNELSESDIEHYLNIHRSENSHLGSELVRGGKVTSIPVRQPLAVMVADGYAAIGDSAFMAIPINGSGIGCSMRAGKILADCVKADKDGLFNCESLWGYQSDYFHEIGSRSCVLAIVKSFLLKIGQDDMAYTFKEQIISSKDFEKFYNIEGIVNHLTVLKPAEIRSRAKKVLNRSNFRKLLSDAAKDITRFLIIETKFPEKYDSEAAAKWDEMYNGFFKSLIPDK